MVYVKKDYLAAHRYAKISFTTTAVFLGNFFTTATTMFYLRLTKQIQKFLLTHKKSSSISIFRHQGCFQKLQAEIIPYYLIWLIPA